MDKKSRLELLEYIIFSIDLIEKRFARIKSVSDFLYDDNGLDILDAISMRLQSIGEAIKSLMKRAPETLLQEANREYWSEIVKLREVISHHYIDIDAEIIFDICSEDLIILKKHIQNILVDDNGVCL